jgi:hypothetical protein
MDLRAALRGKGHHRHRVDTTSDVLNAAGLSDDHHHKSRPSTMEKGK